MTRERPYVLIAEADRPARLYVADNLAADGYQTTSAADEQTAVALLDDTLDALVVDVNGETLALVAAIRAGAAGGADRRLPILALTSHSE